MGNTSSIPMDSPFGCILSHWDKFSLDSLKQKKLISFCDEVWPQYKLEDDEAWPENVSLNYSTILQLDIFCKRQGKWTEVPYVQAFMALRENLELCKSCVREPCQLGPIRATQKPSLVAPGRTGAPDRGPKPQYSSTIFSLSPALLPYKPLYASIPEMQPEPLCPLQEVVVFLVNLRFLMSHCRQNSVRDKVIGKKWIYLERNTLHRQSVGHLRRQEALGETWRG